MTRSDRLMYGTANLLHHVTPTHSRRIMRLIPRYRRCDDELTLRLLLASVDRVTNAAERYIDQRSTA